MNASSRTYSCFLHKSEGLLIITVVFRHYRIAWLKCRK